MKKAERSSFLLYVLELQTFRAVHSPNVLVTLNSKTSLSIEYLSKTNPNNERRCVQPKIAAIAVYGFQWARFAAKIGSYVRIEMQLLFGKVAKRLCCCGSYFCSYWVSGPGVLSACGGVVHSFRLNFRRRCSQF